MYLCYIVCTCVMYRDLRYMRIITESSIIPKDLEVLHSRAIYRSSVNPDNLHAAHMIRIISPPSSQERYLIGLHLRGSLSSKVYEYKMYLSFSLND